MNREPRPPPHPPPFFLNHGQVRVFGRNRFAFRSFRFAPTRLFTLAAFGFYRIQNASPPKLLLFRGAFSPPLSVGSSG